MFSREPEKPGPNVAEYSFEYFVETQKFVEVAVGIESFAIKSVNRKLGSRYLPEPLRQRYQPVRRTVGSRRYVVCVMSTLEDVDEERRVAQIGKVIEPRGLHLTRKSRRLPDTTKLLLRKRLVPTRRDRFVTSCRFRRVFES